MSNFIVFEDSSKTYFGGGQKVTLEVIDSLKDDHKIMVFDFAAKSVFLDKVKQMGFSPYKLAGKGRIKGGSKQSFSLGFCEIVTLPLVLLSGLVRVSNILRKNNVGKNDTILYAATKKTYLLALFLRYSGFNKVVYHEHNLNDTKSLYYLLFRKFLKKAHKILAVSKVTRENIDLNNTKLLYNPCDLENSGKCMPREINRSKKVVAASVSSLLPLKGIDHFIESFGYLNDRVNGRIKYLIYGEGYQKSKLEGLLCNNKNIELKGFVPFEETADDIDILILPSIVPESCPMIVMEANSMGIPVITTDIGGQAELIKDGYNGILVPTGNSRKIAEAVESLIENPGKYNEMSKAAIEASKKFSFKYFKEELNRILLEVI